MTKPAVPASEPKRCSVWRLRENINNKDEIILDISLYTCSPVSVDNSVLNFGWNSQPKKISGLDKLFQMVLKNLIDGLGTVSYDSSLGTDFNNLIFRVTEESEAYAVISTALQLVIEKMKSENSRVSNTDEQLDRIEIEKVYKNETANGWDFTIRVYAVSGNSLTRLFGLA